MTIDYRKFKFRGAKSGDSEPTMGQFLNFIDSNDWSDEEKRCYIFEHLEQPALRIAITNLKNCENIEWRDMKRKLIERFYVKLNIKQKVELKKALMQRFDESCQDFLDRCKKFQYLLCDDDVDSVTERDILINFLLGLRSDFFNTLINNENLQTLEAFFVEAVVLEATLNVKVESHFVESNYDEPTMTKFENVKNIKTEVPIEPEVLLVQVSDSCLPISLQFEMNFTSNC